VRAEARTLHGAAPSRRSARIALTQVAPCDAAFAGSAHAVALGLAPVQAYRRAGIDARNAGLFAALGSALERVGSGRRARRTSALAIRPNHGGGARRLARLSRAAPAAASAAPAAARADRPSSPATDGPTLQDTPSRDVIRTMQPFTPQLAQCARRSNDDPRSARDRGRRRSVREVEALGELATNRPTARATLRRALLLRARRSGELSVSREGHARANGQTPARLVRRNLGSCRMIFERGGWGFVLSTGADRLPDRGAATGAASAQADDEDTFGWRRTWRRIRGDLDWTADTGGVEQRQRLAR
jgi:hypothetical protein